MARPPDPIKSPSHAEAAVVPSPPVAPPGSAVVLERRCSTGSTFDVIGDDWSFMVLRDCFGGFRRFEQLHQLLGLPRNTLTVRLRKLVDEGILRRVPYSTRPLRHEYWVTEAGLALYPVLVTLMHFGDRWLVDGETTPVQTIHRHCGQPCRACVNCSHCGVEVLWHRTTYRAGPGYGTTPVVPKRRGRPTAIPPALADRRPSTTARVGQLIGGRWRFMIIREAFFRARRVEDFQARLGIGTKVLHDQLEQLVVDGLFRQATEPKPPGPAEYVLSEMGRDLFGPSLAMMRWGDDWRAAGEPPLILEHLDCGHDFKPEICCDVCGERLAVDNMHYRMQYEDPPARSDGAAPEFRSVAEDCQSPRSLVESVDLRGAASPAA